MKKIILIMVICWANICLAQNYQNICSPGITFYKDLNGNLQAFRRDSVELPGSSDTVFISYHAIHDTMSGYCIDTSNGSVLGNRVYKSHSGWFYFFNYRKDTIRINTNAGLNTSWHFTKLPGNGYLQATMTGTTLEDVMGFNDSVKNITLQAKDVNNNPIDHPMNQMKIKLSKHYGLFRTPDLYSAPFNYGFQNDTVVFTLAGKSTPQVGLQEAMWKDIYDFEVGDIFHYTGMKMSGVITHEWRKIMTVISKVEYANDSVDYTYQVCTDTLFISSGNHSGIYDTIPQTIKFDDFFEPSFITALPQEFILIDDRSSRYYRRLTPYGFQLERQMKGRYENYIGNSIECWAILVGWDNIFEFTDGLGESFFLDGNSGHNQSERLCYYKKGSETWGAPVSTSCITLDANPIPDAKENLGIQVIPNPISAGATIIISGIETNRGYSVALYNPLGTVVFSDLMDSNTYRFNRERLPAGIYLLVVCDKTGTEFLSKKIILE